VEREPIVVTGAGCVSALGHSVETFWSALQDGRCGLGKLEEPAPSDLKVPIVGAIPAPDPRQMLDARRLPMLDRFSVLAIVAAQQALAQSGLSFENGGHRVGCVVGVGTAGGEAIEELYRKIYLEGAKRANVFTVPRVMPSAPASQISMAYGIRGPVFTVSSACASSNHAIATAVWLLRSSVIDAAIVGGTEAPLTYGILKAWEAMRVMAPDACRPFDRHRKGLVLAEGAGMVVLERADHAKARGAEILAQIAGVGMSADAADLVAPTLDGAARAIRTCLADANLSADAIDYINAHASSTQLNDNTETMSIKEVFGEQAKTIPVSGTKGYYAHPLGATGAIEAALCALALDRQWIPPTINYQNPDPACDLDVVPNHGRAAELNYVMSNSFGFGGINACVILGKVRD